MISEKTLDLAVQQQILTAAQAGRLRTLEAAQGADRLEPQDQEKLRFVSGFGDIFVTIGLLLFLGALAYFGNVYAGQAGGAVTVALASWLLAEFFTRRRRMALPSIVLLLGFAAAVFLAVIYLFIGEVSLFRATPGAPALIAAGSTTAIAATAHYVRFRVPITVAAGGAALVAILAGILLAFGVEVYHSAVNPLMFLCGLLIFAAAMWFDSRDPLRETRRTDIAFWLHLLAAPLIVHPLVSGVWTDSDLSPQGAAAILAVFLALGVVAVLVNRRAILVSGLSYAGIAFGRLIDEAGLSDTALPLTLLALGAFVLLLSAGWTRVRTAILSLAPPRLRAVLPPDLAGAA